MNCFGVVLLKNDVLKKKKRYLVCLCLDLCCSSTFTQLSLLSLFFFLPFSFLLAYYTPRFFFFNIQPTLDYTYDIRTLEFYSEILQKLQEENRNFATLHSFTKCIKQQRSLVCLDEYCCGTFSQLTLLSLYCYGILYFDLDFFYMQPTLDYIYIMPSLVSNSEILQKSTEEKSKFWNFIFFY